ncbi:hypothetical protein [Aquimarina sp. RZ0]|uniref:hypothetical protein n=1 Tax=Aquimarina sp. RZ0 TaxID=2607730 RepID=UPI0011F36A32|nr:hypothetical protein [Aquimarina sp. RZ0]KAA1244254.1 hypothetical protein F0000_17180 [Aquimarina sp. RZ0]
MKLIKIKKQMNDPKMNTIMCCFLLILLFSLVSCENDDVTQNDTTPLEENPNLTIRSSFGGTLYVDGKYINKTLPADIKLSKGTYLLSVGAEGNEAGYYRKEITIDSDSIPQEIEFTKEDMVNPKKWKVLWVTYSKTRAKDGCQISVSQNSIDIAYNIFLDHLEKIEKDAFHAITWEVVQKNYTTEEAPVANESENNTEEEWGLDWTISLEQLKKDFDFNDFDLISFYWPANSDNETSCDGYPLNYGGIASPIPNGMKTIVGVMEHPFINNRYGIQHPSAYTHEWMHTIERLYPLKGFELPIDPGACCTAHSGEAFGYVSSTGVDTFYEDVFKGKVFSEERKVYLGIGPEALWLYQTRNFEASLLDAERRKVAID